MQIPEDIFDLIGLGFGPANLSIAGAIVEAWGTNTSTHPLKRVLFLEKHPYFQWHPGMLLPDARMQISFMKDLATLRSPQSPITFLAYLYSQGRLINFINRGSTIPTRREYADYLSWAAGYVQDHGVNVFYNTEVIGLDTDAHGIVTVISADLASGEITSRRTRNLVISPGGAGKFPHPLSTVSDHPLVTHSAAYLMSIDSILTNITSKGKPRLRIAVIGGGQSAAEVALNLHERLRDLQASGSAHEVDIIIRKGALRPSDDSGFANEIFDPSTTDEWYEMNSPDARQLRVKEYKSTNYSVVNPLTLEALYDAVYAQKVDSDIARRTGTSPSLNLPILKIQSYSNILSVDSPDNDNITFTVQNVLTRAIRTEEYDAVICATGYQRTMWIDLLKKSATVSKVFGLLPACQAETCHLAPEHEKASVSERLTFDRDDSPSTSSSAVSTPPTSPSLSATQFEFPPHRIRITRGYRLLPAEGQSLKSRIYLQGMEEATHGLSDTLLSVLGVRAGEVLADLCKED